MEPTGWGPVGCECALGAAQGAQGCPWGAHPHSPRAAAVPLPGPLHTHAAPRGSLHALSPTLASICPAPALLVPASSPAPCCRPPLTSDLPGPPLPFSLDPQGHGSPCCSGRLLWPQCPLGPGPRGAPAWLAVLGCSTAPLVSFEGPQACELQTLPNISDLVSLTARPPPRQPQSLLTAPVWLTGRGTCSGPAHLPASIPSPGLSAGHADKRSREVSRGGGQLLRGGGEVPGQPWVLWGPAESGSWATHSKGPALRVETLVTHPRLSLGRPAVHPPMQGFTSSTVCPIHSFRGHWGRRESSGAPGGHAGSAAQGRRSHGHKGLCKLGRPLLSSRRWVTTAIRGHGPGWTRPPPPRRGDCMETVVETERNTVPLY